VTPLTRLVLVGHPVSHSLSPRFQNAALRVAGSELAYDAIDVAPEALDQTMRAFVGGRVAGNVTIPHKEAVFALCDERTAIAERVGAVNTFWPDAGRLVGDNTDVGGFDAAFRRAFGPPPDKLRAVIFGAGGAAAAVLAAMENWRGATAIIVARSMPRTNALAARFPKVATTVAPAGPGAGAVVDEVVRNAGLIVNATPAGLADDDGPVDVALCDPTARVFDLAYRHGGTPWVQQARARGLKAIDGLDMLVEQGALSFARWLGVEPDRTVMYRAVSDLAQ